MSLETAKQEAWKRGILKWKLHSAQKEVYAKIQKLSQKVREVAVLISRRWGKSYLGVTMALEDCIRTDGIQVAIIGPNLKQTRAIILPIIKKIAADAPEGFIKETKSELRWQVGKSTLIVAAFDTALESLRGLELWNVYLEETGLAHPDNYDYTLKSVIYPTLMHAKKHKGAGRIHHLTTPAKEIDHPFHTQTLSKCKANGALFVMDITTNPLLTRDEIDEEIEILGGSDSVHTQRELFCRIVRDSSITVCPEFNESYVKEFNIPQVYAPIVAGDFGGVRDKHAFFLMWFDKRDNKIKIWDERIFDPQTSTLSIVNELYDFERSLNYGEDLPRWLDAPGQLLVDLSDEPYNYPATLPKKNTLDESVVELRRPFRRNEIEIHPRCDFLIRSLRSGRFNKNKTDFERTVEFGHLDAIAALIYGIRHVDTRVQPDKRKRATQDVYYDPDRDPRLDNEVGVDMRDYFR